MKPGYRAVMEIVVWVALLLSLCTQTHAQNRPCEDQSPQCPDWAQQGRCETSPNYMQPNCPVSCNVCPGPCEDLFPECPDWAQQGRCETSTDYMLPNCPVSCNFCPDLECYDRSQRCSSMAARGNCRTQPVYMLSICPRSCNNCTQGTPLGATRIRSRTIISPNFDCGQGRSSPSTANVASGSDSRSNIRGDTEGNLADTVNVRIGRNVIFPDDPRYVQFHLGSQILRLLSTPMDRPNQAATRLTSPTSPETHRTNVINPGETEEATTSNLTDIKVGETFCGATPITDRFLITAAHCVLDPENPVHTVRLGELDFADDNEENSRPVDYEVAEIFVHPDYKYTTVERYNDVALILTAKKIDFNDLVFPYCLSPERPPAKTLVTGAGFGLVNETFRSTRLQEAELEVLDTLECEDIYRQEGVERKLRLTYPELLLGRDILCASYPMRDACKGDSGGPLFLDRDNRRYLLGVVGAGVPCKENSNSVQPGLYVSVADHVDFIDSVIYGNQ